MRCRRLRTHSLPLLVAGLALPACGAGSSSAPAQPAFSYRVDATLAPALSSIPDAQGAQRPVVAYADGKGVRTDFVANEVLLAPRDDADLARFLAAHGGTVVMDDHVPDPPAGSGLPALTADQKRARTYTIRVAQLPDAATLATAGAGAVKHMSGDYRFSSEDAVRLIALVAQEKNDGAHVNPNWVFPPSGMLFRTDEAPDGTGGNLDAFGWNVFRGGNAIGGNHSSVYAAWQYLEAHGYAPSSVRLAVIDGGFWIDGSGHPGVTPSIGSDLPADPWQYDFMADVYNAGGPNPGHCTGGSQCNWHGNGSVSVAAGGVNNGAAAAGTGGQVAWPVLFKIDFTISTLARAVRTLPMWGIGVANMSFGGSCNDDCVDDKDDAHVYSYFDDARVSRVVMVASAGNDALNVDAHDYQPCTIGGVICVGALAGGSNHAIDYSNFGGSVDLWAPTNIPAMPDGDSPNDLTTHTGTSASSPFVAGVAAMMKALDPTLSTDDAFGILHATAIGVGLGGDKSKDPKVAASGYLDAYRAVTRAGKNDMPDDAFDPNHETGAAAAIADQTYAGLTLRPSVSDWFSFSMLDYGYVAADLGFMHDGLGWINTSLATSQGFTSAESVQESDSAVGSTWSGFLKPGNYYLRVWSNYPNYYDLRFQRTTTGLTPDSFEPDDSVSGAAEPKPGSYAVNLHQDSDLDYYRFAFSAPPQIVDAVGGKFSVAVKDADFPVQLVVLDATGQVQRFSQTGTDVSYGAFTPSDVGKTFYARVVGSKTRYRIGIDWHVSGGAFAPPLTQDPCWWDDPGSNPWFGLLTNPEDWIAIVVSPSMDTITMPTSGLELGLFGDDGAELGTAVPVTGLDRPGGRALDVKSLGLADGRLCLLKVTRTDHGAGPAAASGAQAVAEAIPYQLAVTH